MARGGNGGLSAGGGGASGGAITLIDGNLTIEDSVCQSLAASGGSSTGATMPGKNRPFSGITFGSSCPGTVERRVGIN